MLTESPTNKIWVYKGNVLITETEQKLLSKTKLFSQLSLLLERHFQHRSILIGSSKLQAGASETNTLYHCPKKYQIS